MPNPLAISSTFASAATMVSSSESTRLMPKGFGAGAVPSPRICGPISCGGLGAPACRCATRTGTPTYITNAASERTLLRILIMVSSGRRTSCAERAVYPNSNGPHVPLHQNLVDVICDVAYILRDRVGDPDAHDSIQPGVFLRSCFEDGCNRPVSRTRAGGRRVHDPSIESEDQRRIVSAELQAHVDDVRAIRPRHSPFASRGDERAFEPWTLKRSLRETGDAPSPDCHQRARLEYEVHQELGLEAGAVGGLGRERRP